MRGGTQSLQLEACVGQRGADTLVREEAVLLLCRHGFRMTTLQHPQTITRQLTLSKQSPMQLHRNLFRSRERSTLMKSTLTRYALCLMVSCLASRPASSATASASFGVSVTVLASCTVSASTMELAAQADRNTTEAVSVTCSHPIPYSISLSAGSANRGLPDASHPVGSASAVSHDPSSPHADTITVTVTY